MGTETTIRIQAEDRFDRFRRIEWWDQRRLSNAKVLVIGAGALGNEILKNLALLGVGHIFIADLDSIEDSNLSRSILFRDRDVGRSKAETAAVAVHDIYPDLQVRGFQGDVTLELGLGVYRWADLVIAGLDNREARLHVNRCCFRLNKPWIDAATEALRGAVRFFLPGGPCFECTMSAGDWDALAERRGCAGLRVEGVASVAVPTTPITASILAAIQVQEALKLLHGRDDVGGRGLVFDGLTNELYSVTFSRAEDCGSHDPLDNVISLAGSATTTTAKEVLDHGRRLLGAGAQIDLARELLVSLDCAECGVSEPVLQPMARVSERKAFCPTCKVERRPVTAQSIFGDEPFANRPLVEIGIPLYDIVAVRNELNTVGFELSADASTVLNGARSLGSAGVT